MTMCTSIQDKKYLAILLHILRPNICAAIYYRTKDLNEVVSENNVSFQLEPKLLTDTTAVVH